MELYVFLLFSLNLFKTYRCVLMTFKLLLRLLMPKCLGIIFINESIACWWLLFIYKVGHEKTGSTITLWLAVAVFRGRKVRLLLLSWKHWGEGKYHFWLRCWRIIFFLLWKFEKFKKGGKKPPTSCNCDWSKCDTTAQYPHTPCPGLFPIACRKSKRQILQKPRTARRISEEEGP